MTDKIEITGVLKSVMFETWGNSRIAWGYVYDDVRMRFRDGTHIHTSSITKVEDDLIHTLNSVYRIESYRLET